ncbi:MAG: hypothetical protein Q9220_005982 [cf. Caloplaca sp. 1 TL-2023]
MPLKLKPPSLPTQPPPDTPSSATSVKRKLTLTFGSASQPTPPPTDLSAPTPPPKKPKAPRKPKVDKPARTPKPTSKKRDLDASALVDDIAEEPKGNGLDNVKRLKLNVFGSSKVPPPPQEPEPKIRYVRTKFKGKIPERPIGVGYDSGSSDIEVDPALEEEFILRMHPGDDCEYLRKAIAERRFGPTHEGGADIRMQFLRQDGRRAIVSIQKRLYAACLVDLPCVIEGMKSWDKKAWFKTADVCQMLLVLGRIENEADAVEYPLPRDIDPQTWQYAHGLTPPMRYARKRRFRKRISNRTIEAVEEEVERLCQLDEECANRGGDSFAEIIDLDRMTQEQADQAAREQAQDTLEFGDDDADGEEDAEGDDEVEEEEDDEDEDIENNFEPIEPSADDDAAIEAALAAAMDEDDEEVADTLTSLPAPSQEPPTAAAASPAPSTPAPPTPSQVSDGATPPATANPIPSSDNTSDEDDIPEDEEEELDESEQEKQQERERQWAEVNDMKTMIRNQEEKARVQMNAILKGKILSGVRALRRDLGVKLAALGVDEEEDGVEQGV